jgi:PAS domain S-box-containing protein
MSVRLPGQIHRSDWRLMAVSLAVFVIYAFYAVSYVFLTPYPGVEITAHGNGWLVNDSVQASLKIDDVLVQIGDQTYAQFRDNWLQVPFKGYYPGDRVPSVKTADGRTIELVMPQPGADDRLKRLVGTVWFFPFWLAGTAILLFLRPRDRRWKLLIATMYLTGLWIVVGSIATWQLGGSRYTAVLVGWAMVPIFLHLHFTVPSPLKLWRSGLLIGALYTVSAVLAITELLLETTTISVFAIALAIICSFGLLVYRTVGPGIQASDRHSARLMLAGLGLAFGPAVMLFVFPTITDITVPNALALGIAFISLPILPVFYTYAIYKRQLGALEFRTNRLLSLYSFILVYPTLFVIVLLLGEQWTSSSGTRTVYLLFVSIVFVLAIPPLMRRMQEMLNRLAYGTEHDPDDILRVFARQIPSAPSRKAVAISLTKDILPAMLIRQSALILVTEDGQVDLLYSERVPEGVLPASSAQVRTLQASAGVYWPPDLARSEGQGWIRLAISLVTREEAIGVWLFGRRDPDDFYPQNDIDLLQTLASQMAPVIENMRLYEELQKHAESLAEQVAERTAELQAEKERSQAILDSAGEGIFFTDQAGIILYTNAEMARQTGYSTDELRGKTLDLWQTDESQPERYREMWTAIYTGSGWSGELLLNRQDSALVDVSLAIAPIVSQEHELTGFVGVQSDISKLKEVDRIKSNIISSVSHELKTPLTTIRTYLMLLQRGKPEKRGGYMDVLDRETDRLTHIIEDLLDLAKLETGITSQSEPVSMNETVMAVFSSCATRANEKAMSLSSSISPDLPYALIDRGQFDQVVTNLVVNAINYTQAGGQIIVDAGVELGDEQPLVWLRVKDNGPGISPLDMPHLFDRFYRGDTALESGAPGTGLGLAICNEIVERHKGHIDVESQPGAGAAFTVWLPAALSERFDFPVVLDAEVTRAGD